MKKILSIIGLVLIFVTTGCMTQSEFSYDTPENLNLDTNAQNAVFYTAFGWTGGPAGVPVINLKSGRPMQFEKEDIYLDEESEAKLKALIEEKGVFSNIVKVSANITLNADSNGEITLPPTEEGGAPVMQRRGYTALQINELFDILGTDKFGREIKE